MPAELGHRDITVLVETNQPAGSPGRRLDLAELTYLDYAARVEGLRKAMPGQVAIVSGGHNSIESGASATGWLLDGGEPPTAIVCLSDVLALGVLQALASRGLATRPRKPPISRRFINRSATRGNTSAGC